MSAPRPPAEETRAGPWFPSSPVDLGWRNVVFALRTAAAALAALAIAYWMELSDPQWATLTVYLLAQPTVGAAVAKGAWRTLGTLAGGLAGLVIVALFSQAAELMVGVTALAIGTCFYVGARLRNYAAYAVMLAGYTMLLVAYEGSLDPLNAWTVAADRTGEILIGIACITAASTIVVPRYAGDALREGLAGTFSGLARYVATAMRLSEPPAVFAALRQRMVAGVVSFDALRSYALFEAPEMRANGPALARSVREFLVVLAVARGVYFRLDAFQKDGQAVLERMRPALDGAVARLEAIAADPAALSDPHHTRRELLAARAQIAATAGELEAMAGQAPFEPLANGVLIMRRAGDLLHGLSMVVVTEAASLRRDARAPAARRAAMPAEGRGEALLIALRAALAIVTLSAIWMATAWSSGFSFVAGGAIMLFFAVNQDNPIPAARTFLVWSMAGIAAAYALMVLVLPALEGFEALAAALMLVLLPAGLMAGTPSRAWGGIALGGFTISQAGTGNVFTPDELAFFNNALALLLGMVVCLALLAAMPVNSRARRGQCWQRAIGELLPAVARGKVQPRRAAGEIVTMLAGLLPRLSLDRLRDEDFFRGTLGTSSCAVELGRLIGVAADRATPPETAHTLAGFLGAFAGALERLAASRADRPARVAEAEALVAEARAALAAQMPSAPGEEARAVLRAGASLRFIADRFDIDRPYLLRSFAEG
ncbi:FUSC family protein [Starkeya koreensis]|uniref:FUSC family protein n=1 Tax=Ancylobacter koreensis TaxID=266121 RepID=A0ABT0DIJ5_9HYPH|nr:FUSC family protein [Ancylobacter koreensis]